MINSALIKRDHLEIDNFTFIAFRTKIGNETL